MRASNKRGICDDLSDSRINRGLNAQILGVEINEGNFHELISSCVKATRIGDNRSGR